MESIMGIADGRRQQFHGSPVHHGPALKAIARWCMSVAERVHGHPEVSRIREGWRWGSRRVGCVALAGRRCGGRLGPFLMSANAIGIERSLIRWREGRAITQRLFLCDLANHHALVATQNGRLDRLLLCCVGELALASSGRELASLAFATASDAWWGTRIIDTFFIWGSSDKSTAKKKKSQQNNAERGQGMNILPKSHLTLRLRHGSQA
jgi:hypothetical protein